MGFNPKWDDEPDVLSEINMIPLVDIMLVLLIIFMITVPVLTHSVKLDLPNAQNIQTQVKPETITLSISKDGSVYWDGQLMNEADLNVALNRVAAQVDQPEIHIHGDRQASYEYIVRAMAAAQRAGIRKLGFITQPDS